MIRRSSTQARSAHSRVARRTAYALAAVLSLAPILLGASPADDAAAELEYFESKVRPILVEHCYECHTGAKPKGGLRLDRRDLAYQGGDSGAAFVPGDLSNSRLIRAVSYEDIELQMPPRGQLDADKIAVLRRWIESGAAWPADARPEESKDATGFDLWARKQAHWAWQPIRPVEPPAVADPSWPDGAIDAFLLSALEQNGLRPAPPADPRTLLRRVYFDLIGVPPAPEELDAFAADPSPAAYERCVDRLLESPRFGERWARHWMDLVRYAESYGHEFDYPIEQAWRYRDYLIRAFNADVRYDQFVLEQVAGDLLDPPRIDPASGINESILGTGHWFMHQATHAPVDVRNDQAERIDNQIDVLSKTFLGLTVSCARCHDHKFDAISTRDFYALYGIIESSRRQEALLDPHGRISSIAGQLESLAAAAQRDLVARLPPDSAFEKLEDALSAAIEVPAPSELELLLEADDLKQVERTRGEARRQDLDASKWTRGGHLWWTDAQPGDRLQLEIAVETAGEYEIALSLTQARDYARVRIAFDDRVLSEDFDLYQKDVVSTGFVAFGVHPVTAGPHRLCFEILGANAAAEPRYMVGVDQVRLRRTDSVLQREQAIERTAARRGIPADRLARAADLLDRAELSERAHPWFAWAQAGRRSRAAGTDPARFPALRSELLTEWSAALAAAQASREQGGARVFADFETEGFGAFDVTGWAFGAAPTRPAEVEIDANTVSARFSTPGVVHSGRLARRLQGVLRSPEFVIDSDFIHYRMKGEGAQIRLIVEGYVLDVYNSLLFEGMAFDVQTGGRWDWYAQRVKKYRGRRAHLELIDHGDGWLAVDAIVFGDETAADPAGWAEAIARLEPAVDWRVLCHGVAAEARAALAALRAGRADRDATEIGAILAEVGLVVEDVGLVVKEVGLGVTEAAEARAESKAAQALKEWSRLAAELPAPVHALAWRDGPGADEHVFIRGRHGNPGEPVPRRFLEAIGGDAQAPITHGSGRLELARWLVDPRNPLSARVIVNRLWQHLFGTGIVPSVDNFGVLGQPPSHPELLDWLAHWFSADGDRSIKRTLRLLVNSRAYRMSSVAADADAERIDPQNTLLHRMRVRRLEGEAIRDAILCTSGRIDWTMYGPSVPIHLTGFMDGRGRPDSNGPLDGAGRRSLYVEVRRNFLAPMMLAFDTPIPASTVGLRSVSNVPAQALILMNDPFVVEQAGLWAARVLAVPSRSPEQRIDAMYRTAFARPATPEEIAAARQFLADQANNCAVPDDDPRVWTDLAHVLFNVKEFVFLR